MKIKAKFKGRDSLGYENGKTYTLRFKTESDNGDDRIGIHHIISDLHKGSLITLRRYSYCHYSSLKSFLNNWQVL